jgi:hypothetical protein
VENTSCDKVMKKEEREKVKWGFFIHELSPEKERNERMQEGKQGREPVLSVAAAVVHYAWDLKVFPCFSFLFTRIRHSPVLIDKKSPISIYEIKLRFNSPRKWHFPPFRSIIDTRLTYKHTLILLDPVYHLRSYSVAETI